MAVVDVAGFIADLKEHAAEHGFHVHDERHFVETYSMRQAFEVDLHPEAACGGPLDLHLSLDLEPRTLMAFEDEVMSLSEEADPSDDLTVQIVFTWALPPLEHGPDLLVLATELAGLGGTRLPTEVSAMDPTAPRMPALLNITSSWPHRATAMPTAAATSSSDVTSVNANAAESPSSAARDSPISCWMSARTTDAPSSTNRRAVPAPMPLAAPVMTATMPSRRPDI